MNVRHVQSPLDIEKAYPCSTESPIPIWADGLPMCREWLANSLGEFIDGLHLEDENGFVIGHVYWAPSNSALAPHRIEQGVAYIYCDWVQEKHRGKGGAHLLFQELVKLLNSQDYKGILVGATDFEGYMYYPHYLKRGFHIISESDGGKLMYFPLNQASIEVAPLTASLPKMQEGEVDVLVIGSRSCPVGASAVLLLRKVAKELGERVVVKEVPASKESIARYGVADGIFINRKAKFLGPVTENQVRQAIMEELSN